MFEQVTCGLQICFSGTDLPMLCPIGEPLQPFKKSKLLFSINLIFPCIANDYLILV